MRVLQHSLLVLVLSTSLAFAAVPEAVKTFLLRSDDSCVGKCNQGLLPNAPCQCNSACVGFGDCCSDYSAICSCESRCDLGYVPENDCQCNDECGQHNNCCQDYEDFCSGGSGGTLTDAELIELSEMLIDLDESGLGEKVSVDFQGQTSQCSQSDEAPDNFITTFDESIWEWPTVALMKKLFDNHDPAVGVNEDNTAEEQAEEEAFLDAVMESQVMQTTYEFLNTRSVFTGTVEDFRAKLKQLWFGIYDRSKSGFKAGGGSSGFEHVFIGELKNGEVSGFHNWLHFFYEEQAGNIDYLGWLYQADFQNGSGGVTNVFKWLNQMKCIGSMYFGTPPELDLAVFTACYLTREGQACNMAYNGVPFKITTYNFLQGGKEFIGTAYPDFN